MKILIILFSLSLFLSSGCYRAGSNSESPEIETDSAETVDTADATETDSTETEDTGDRTDSSSEDEVQDTGDSETTLDSSTSVRDTDSEISIETDMGTDIIDSETDSSVSTDSLSGSDDDDTGTADTNTETEHDSETDSETDSGTTVGTDSNVDCAGEAVWYDATTDLCWESVPGNDEVTFLDALDRCETATTGGYADWQLPDVIQLRSMIRGCPDTETGGACLDYPEIIEACLGCGAKESTDGHPCYWEEHFGSLCKGAFWTLTRSYHDEKSVVDFERAAIVRDWPGDLSSEPSPLSLPSAFDRTWCVRQPASE